MGITPAVGQGTIAGGGELGWAGGTQAVCRRWVVPPAQVAAIQAQVPAPRGKCPPLHCRQHADHIVDLQPAQPLSAAARMQQ